MPGPALLLLGPPRLERDGYPVQVDTRKALALAAYLAVTGQRVSRDALAALLWPDYDEARAALRRTLSVLNKALGEGCLEIDRGHVGLDRRGGLWVDLDHFRRQLAECRSHGHPVDETCPDCIPPLEAAADLYRNDFLAGFSLRDSPEFDDWQFFQAEGLRRELGGVLGRLTRLLAAQARFEEATVYARRWLGLDALHEPAHRTLMELYTWAGQRSAALRQYETCARVLAEELNIPPLEATSRLYQAIKENRPPPPPGRSPRAVRSPAAAASAAATATVTPRPAEPLVGREAEWDALQGAYAAARDGGRVVVLKGEAGIGKTRLAEAFLAEARASGALALTARSYEGAPDLAYGTFVELLRAATGQMDRDGVLKAVPSWALREVARLLPELGGQNSVQPVPLETPGAQTRFFEGISQVFLTALGDDRPALLFFDDAQWADPASLDLLAYLARRVRGRPLCVMVSWRDDHDAPGCHLHHLLSDAQRAGTLTAVRLSRLSRSSVDELVTWAMNAGASNALLPPDLGRRLHDETEGVPLFLREYLSALTTGGLRPTDDDWELPGGLRGVLRSRFAAISAPGRHALSVAATIGRSFDFDTLQIVSGRDDETAVAALEELVERSIVEEVPGRGKAGEPTYDFRHEKLRTLAYEEISLARRRLLHRRVAEALAGRVRASYDDGTSAAQIAHHFRRAGQERDAAAHFARAGERARALFANVEALNYFRTALELGHPDGYVLREAIGDLLTLLGEYNSALLSYEAAVGAPTATDRARVERKRADVYHRRGEWALAERGLRAAVAVLGEADARAERARLRADLSLVVHQMGRTDEATVLAREALSLAEADDDPRSLARVHNVLGILAGRRGNHEEARRHLEQSVAMARSLGDPATQVAALNNLALAHGAAGEIECALGFTEAALALCAAQGDRHREAALHNNLADLLHAAGRSAAAGSHVREAVAIYAQIGVEGDSVRPEIWKLAEW